MTRDDQRALATLVLYFALADSTGRNNSPESRLVRRGMAALKTLKHEPINDEPQPQNST